MIKLRRKTKLHWLVFILIILVGYCKCPHCDNYLDIVNSTFKFPFIKGATKTIAFSQIFKDLNVEDCFNPNNRCKLRPNCATDDYASDANLLSVSASYDITVNQGIEAGYSFQACMFCTSFGNEGPPE